MAASSISPGKIFIYIGVPLRVRRGSSSLRQAIEKYSNGLLVIDIALTGFPYSCHKRIVLEDVHFL